MSGVFPVARFGATAWVWTIGFCAAALFFGWGTVNALANGRTPDNYDLGASLLLVTVIIASWARSARRYRVTDGNLYIDRWVIGRITIPLESITLIEALATPVSFFNIGLLSTGGLFGWAGKTHLRKLNDRQALQAELYGTNPAKVVIVGLNDDRTYALTPADPGGLVNVVRAGMQPVKTEEGYLSKANRRTRKDKKR